MVLKKVRIILWRPNYVNVLKVLTRQIILQVAPNPYLNQRDSHVGSSSAQKIGQFVFQNNKCFFSEIQ